MLNKLIELFLKFPGIGPRQAKRFAYFLAGEDEQFRKNLASLILEMKKEIKQCDSCYRFFSKPGFDEKKPGFSNQCNICSSLNRDKNLLMVVEKDVDLENIERAGVYNGRYFVLGGTIPLTLKSNFNGQKSDFHNLRFEELFNKVKKESPKEVILALSATVEGENTSRYIEKILEPLKIKTTILGRGLSTGTELEYSDSETIKNALESRK
jgi:recombination protein RecR